uniref:Uncharacterized protein n=1 Tax=viral metagenome TaxID=1070528 RepID=A0A6C0EW30_9ZZZZ
MKKMKYLILLFFITISVMYYINYKEGFKSDYSDYNTIDRIKTGTNNYAYCIAGQITCPSGNRIVIDDNYKGGKTYDYLCSNNTQVECKGNFQHKMNVEQLEWKTPSSREISFPYSDDYKGFTTEYDYIPVDISGQFMNFYDSSGDVLDNINKCTMLNSDIDTYKCNIASISRMFDLFEKGITSFLDDLPIGDALKKLINKPQTSTSNTKCIANYGTTVGKPLCCGQTGVLQKSSTEYVCPASKPTCAGYTCGHTYGTCS